MFRLIVAIVVTLALTYFAVQNTQPATLMLAGYTLSDTPLYIIVLGSLLLGFVFGLLFHLVYKLSSHWTLRGKDKDLKQARETIADLTKRVHELELEKASLTADVDTDDKAI